MRKILIGVVLAVCFAMISLTLVGKSLPRPTGPADSQAAKQMPADELFAAVVTVARVAPADFAETVLATGSLVAREEILVGPEVEGLRVTEVLADEGTRVKKGDVLARLVADTLDAQLAQNDAAIARTTAAHRAGQGDHRAGGSAPGRSPQRLRAGQAPAPGRPHDGGRVRPARAGRQHRGGAACGRPGRAEASPRPRRRRWKRSAAS